MKIRDLTSIRMKPAEITAAFFIDMFISSLPGVSKEKAIGVNGCHPRTICRRGPKTGAMGYALFDPAVLDDPCELEPLPWYIESVYKQLTGRHTPYASLIATPEARAWCRGAVFQTSEAEVLFRTEDVGGNTAPWAIVTLTADAANYNILASLTANGFLPYGRSTFVLFM